MEKEVESNGEGVVVDGRGWIVMEEGGAGGERGWRVMENGVVKGRGWRVMVTEKGVEGRGWRLMEKGGDWRRDMAILTKYSWDNALQILVILFITLVSMTIHEKLTCTDHDDE